LSSDVQNVRLTGDSSCNTTVVVFVFEQITKPLLERKRRARINRCLDELKDLMFSLLEVNRVVKYDNERVSRASCTRKRRSTRLWPPGWFFFCAQAEGENVDKLEKADILEFTVRHLQKITRRDPVEEAYKFQVSPSLTRPSTVPAYCPTKPERVAGDIFPPYVIFGGRDRSVLLGRLIILGREGSVTRVTG